MKSPRVVNRAKEQMGIRKGLGIKMLETECGESVVLVLRIQEFGIVFSSCAQLCTASMQSNLHPASPPLGGPCMKTIRPGGCR
jgi:hypothetical protein